MIGVEMSFRTVDPFEGKILFYKKWQWFIRHTYVDPHKMFLFNFNEVLSFYHFTILDGNSSNGETFKQPSGENIAPSNHVVNKNRIPPGT